MRRASPSRGIAAALLLALAAGCSRNEPSPRPDPFERDAAGVTIQVRNQYETAVILHAYGPSLSERLGSLGPGRTASWVVPWTREGLLRVRAEPESGPHVESNALSVHPGDAVIFTVATDITRSVLIYRR